MTLEQVFFVSRSTAGVAVGVPGTAGDMETELEAIGRCLQELRRPHSRENADHIGRRCLADGVKFDQGRSPGF